MTTPSPLMFAAPLKPGETTLGKGLAALAAGIVRSGDAGAARSQQRAIGPSEWGTPCVRQLAYKLFHADPCNLTTDPLARTIGTAMHAWLADVVSRNQDVMPDGRPRFVVETRVVSPGAPAGSCDVYDRLLRVVIDWKLLGHAAMLRYRKEGVGQTYRVQAHTYGAGFLQAGEPVEHVAVVMIPKTGDLRGIEVWTEPLDLSVVAAASARLDAVVDLGAKLDVEHHPERFHTLPAAPSYLCEWCPFYAGDGSPAALGCPGGGKAAP